MHKIKIKLLNLAKRYASLSFLVAYSWALANAFIAIFYRLKYLGRVILPFSVKLIGIRKIRIGSNTSIGAGSWLNVNDRKSQSPHVISIGENCIIGRNNFFSAGVEIEIGDYCLTTNNCSFIGSTHIYENPMIAYSCTGTKQSDHITVGANCFFGYGAQVIGNVKIGHGCVIGSGAVVKKDIPPFSLVVGNPAKIIKRYDFDQKSWVPWPAGTHFREGPDEAEYLSLLKSESGFILQPVSVVNSMLFDVR
ncbi:acyltransferase [Pseudomonas sp. GCM10022186]|uniref:acyltransferase n=1 Tax=Pseudomonas sp. GCM10022186 TaxID=3252650 RepID=UPI003616FC45